MAHEPFCGNERLSPGSNRNFGLIVGTVLAVLGALKIWHGSAYGYALGLLSAACLLLAWLWPHMLEWPNRLWSRLGLVLQKVISPLVMALIFFLVILPIGALMRLCGKSPLALKFDRKVDSYWTARAVRPGSMGKQY